MTIYEFNGGIYNLTQLVSMQAAGTDDDEFDGRKEKSLRLVFSSGSTLKLPSSERERVLQLLGISKEKQ